MRAAWLEIDLDAYRRNLRALRELCATRVLAVVKANANGHGLVPMARAAIEAGAWGVGVAQPEEGIALRDAGFGERVVVLGRWPPEQAARVLEADLESGISGGAAGGALA